MAVIGVLEVTGSVALLVPRLCGLAALAFVALMVGAVATTLIGLDAPRAVVPATVLVMAAVVARGRRDRTAALVALARGLRR
jgi:putative oxidoreductase